MNKVIHGAIRRDLDRFAKALAFFPPGDRERVKQLGVAWENFDEQLTDHHEGEHEIAWPALEQVGVTREALHQMDAEHAAMAEALGNARSAMQALVSRPDSRESEAALTPSATRGFTVTQHDHEEQQIEPVYLEQHDTPEMKAMGKPFAKAGPSRPARSSHGSSTAPRPTWSRRSRARSRTRPDGDGRPLRAELPQERRSGLEGLTPHRRLPPTGRARRGSGRRMPAASPSRPRAWSILETTHWFFWVGRTHSASKRAEVVRTGRGRGTPWAIRRPVGRRWQPAW